MVMLFPLKPTQPASVKQAAVLQPVYAAVVCFAIAPTAYAEAVSGSTSSERQLPQVNIIGGSDKLPSLAGAGQTIDDKDLEVSRPFTVNEALRRVAGVVVRDEEGFGLRPNIAIRGLNPTRSTKTTLLEDGIPLAYAPYGDNASYFHPPIERYSGIEVLKGASSLLFGPQTIGGIVNYITPTPRQTFGGSVQATFGNRDFRSVQASIGGKGLQLDFLHKEGRSARDAEKHSIDDIFLKYVVALTNNQALTLRANYYQERSAVSYSGITQAEFNNFGARYNPERNATFDTERGHVSATHELQLDSGGQVLTNFYYSRFDRDWWRQQSNSADGQCGVAFTAMRVAGQRVNIDSCNSNQGRLRSYYNAGVEPRLTLPNALGEFSASVKLHTEEQDRLQVNANTPAGRSGTTVESNLRTSDVLAGHVSQRFDFGQFSVTPILRYESVEAERINRLVVGQSGNTKITEILPGLGITWNPTKDLTVFSSLHKGFAPPRVEDLIGGTGTFTDVSAEESTNFEVGVRAQPIHGTSVQAALFRTKFQNLIAVGSIAGGGTPLSQGEALFQGLEFSGNYQDKSGFNTRVAYTYLPTAEQSTAFRNVANSAVVGVQGNRQPYAPRNTLTAAFGYRAGPLAAEVEAQHVGEQFTDFANTVNPGADGQRGVISAYTVFNASLNYQFDKALSAFVTVKNLTDKTYIVDRTRGILVGQPRLVQAGVRYRF